MKKHILSLAFLALTLGFSANAWADHTFANGTVIYVDMTAITTSNFTAKIFVDHGLKYSAKTISGSATFTTYNSGEFQNCNAPLIQLTFKESATISSTQTIFECGAGDWAKATNQFPSVGQDLMTVSSDGKTITWGTYTPSSDCTNCKTITKQ